MVLEFDADGTPKETDLISFFKEDVQPSMKALMEQKGQVLDIWEEVNEKTVEVEANVTLQPIFDTKEMDHWGQRGMHPVDPTTMKEQT